MSRILIIYASHFGQTRKIAETLAHDLRGHGFTVEVADVDAKPPSPDGFDAVVIGSRIEMGRHAPELAAYVRAHVESLTAVPTAFFVVCNAAARPDAGTDPSGYAQSFFDDVGWHPTISTSFAGALFYRKYNFILRFIMKRIAKAAGHPTDTSRDHDLTDWVHVTRFADDILHLFPHEVAVHHV